MLRTLAGFGTCARAPRAVVRLVALASVVAVAAPAIGQAPEPTTEAADPASVPSYGESIEIVAVEVPVEVVRRGVAVRGLTRDNFELYEDGERRELSGFEAIDFGRGSGAQQAKSAAAADAATRSSAATAMTPGPSLEPRRNLLLLFDFGYSEQVERVRVLRDARRFVDERLGPSDYVAVAVAGGWSGAARLVVPFTLRRDWARLGLDFLDAVVSGSRSAMRRAANELVVAGATRADRGRLAELADELGPTTALAAASLGDLFAAAPPTMDLDTAGGRTEGLLSAGERSGAGDAGSDPSFSSVVAGDPVLLAADLAEGAAASAATSQLAGLAELLTLLRDLPGRKLLLFYSHGADSALLRKLDSRDRARILGALEHTFAAARRGGWSIHPIDLTGIPISGTPASTPLDPTPASTRTDPGRVSASTDRRAAAYESDTLIALADATGGVLHENFNDFAEASDQVLAASDVSYVLTFQRPEAAHDGRLHEIEVRLVGAPAGARAIYRAGNQAPLPERRRSAAERRLDRAALILGHREIGELEVALAATPRPDADGRWRVAVALSLAEPAQALTPGAGGRVELEVAGFAIAPDLAVSASFSNRLRLDLEQLGASLAGAPLRMTGELVLPAGSYRLRVLVRDLASGSLALHGTALELGEP